MEVLSRVGYMVHGVIYIMIGVLAARIAWGDPGWLTDPTTAIALIDSIPHGDILVGVIAAGLVGYALWRFVQAVADPDQQGTTVRGLIVRTGRCVSGLGYLALAAFAARLVADSPQDGGMQRNWAYRLLSEPLGAFAGGLIGLILIGVATDDVRKACTRNFGERFKHEEMKLFQRTASECAGRWGFAARALILTFGGIYLLRAVFAAQPQRAKGFTGILASFLMMPFGNWLLGFVALGLAAHGLYMVHAGLYRRHPF